MCAAVLPCSDIRCPCPAVVFGRVTEGQGLLQKVNAVGTRSGKPKQRVVIVDCGELPSKRQIMLKLQVLTLSVLHKPQGSALCVWHQSTIRRQAGHEQLQDGHILHISLAGLGSLQLLDMWCRGPMSCHVIDLHFQAEKEELVALKNSAPEVDADEESRARLAALRGEDAGPKKAVDLPFRTAQVRASKCAPEVHSAIGASYM